MCYAGVKIGDSVVMFCSFTSENENIKVFGLNELYNEHMDYIEEIIDKAQAYNSTCYNLLKKSFSGLEKTSAEIDRYIWGSYLETAEHSKRLSFLCWLHRPCIFLSRSGSLQFSLQIVSRSIRRFLEF